MDPAADSELGLSEDILRELLELGSGKLPAPEDLPEGARQILIVGAYQLVSAAWLRSTAAPVTDAQSVLILHGEPSPSSDPDLRCALIRVISDGDALSRPTYRPDRGIIYITLWDRQLPALLRQLDDAEVYCWIGHFEGGHVYGDVHSRRR